MEIEERVNDMPGIEQIEVRVMGQEIDLNPGGLPVISTVTTDTRRHC